MSEGKGKGGGQIPVGLERVLYIAATEPVFRDALLQDPEAAVTARGLSLRPTELAMLGAVPRTMLESHIASVDPSPENVGRRTFMGAVAASAMTVAAADALSGCNPSGDTGVRPDRDFAKAGIPPDMPGAKKDGGAGKDGASKDTVAAPDSNGPAPTGIRPGGG